MEARLQEMAAYFHHHNLTSKAAARLFLDIYDGEPPAVADLEAIGRTFVDFPSGIMMAGDIPTFLGGPWKNQVRHFPDIARAQFTAYRKPHSEIRPLTACSDQI